MQFEKNSVSVVTVVYNGVNSIRKTIESILAQNYSKLEIIVIDGNSNDGTQAIINEYNKHITHFMSEPDQGIYDAMNKGINLAKNEWIYFLNSDDEFCDSNCLADIFSSLDSTDVDVIYSDDLCEDKNGSIKKIPARDLNSFNFQMPFGHQSCLVRTSLMKKNLFSQNFKIAGDFNFLSSLYLLEKRNFIYTPFTLGILKFGGISQSGASLVRIEHMRVIESNSSFPKLYLLRYRLRLLVTKVKRALNLI